MRDLFVTLVVFGSLPLILWRPFYGVIMWIWIGYMNPHRISWGFATEMPFAMLIALSTFVGLLFSKESKRIPWTKESVSLLLFVLWMCLTTYFAFDTALAGVQLEKVLKIQFMTFVSLILLTTRDRVHAAVWTIALSLGFYGIKGGLFTILTGGGYHVLGPPGTFIGGNNETGLALLMTLPLIRYLQVEEPRRWLRLGLIGALVLTLVAVLGTQSRGALVGLLVMGTIFVWKSPHRLTFMLVMALAVPVVLGFMPESWWARMETIRNYEGDASAMGRIIAWKLAWSIGTSHFLGGGFEALVASGSRDVHSIYFEVLSEHGFVGLTLFLLLLAFTWLSAGWTIRNAGRHAELRWAANLARMLQVSGIAYCATGTFLGMAYFDYIYMLIALTVATRQIVAKHIAGLEVYRPVAGDRARPTAAREARHLIPTMPPDKPAGTTESPASEGRREAPAVSRAMNMVSAPVPRMRSRRPRDQA